MLLGIDFGTTRTVVAAVDRGNYPIVSFRAGKGSWIDWYPSLIASRDGELLFGHRAAKLRGEPGVWHLQSIKRLLGHLAPDAPIEIPNAGQMSVFELLRAYLESLRSEILGKRTSLSVSPGESLDVLISVPANSNGNQRFTTIEAFKAAGFNVLGLLNEPSAAGVEYAHRYIKRPEGPRTKEYLAVYDLGGGTFDAAAIHIAGMHHEVVASEGVERLGGDDFDRILYDMVLEHFEGIRELPRAASARLLDECRERKESLHPNTRKLLIDMSGVAGTLDEDLEANLDEEVVVEVSDYYDRCQPLIDRTLDCLDRVLTALPDGEDDEQGLPQSVATIYLVGGSVNFPIVSRRLRDRYGRRVQRSPYPHGAVAIGLAVASNPDENYFVRETLTRHFGVWREADDGSRVVFDPIFLKNSSLDNGPGRILYAVRRYNPAHNLGHFRFVECGSLSPDGLPTNDVAPWGSIWFPFDPELQARTNLSELAIERRGPSSHVTVVEEYTCDLNGIVHVLLREESTGFVRSYRLDGSFE